MKKITVLFLVILLMLVMVGTLSANEVPTFNLDSVLLSDKSFGIQFGKEMFIRPAISLESGGEISTGIAQPLLFRKREKGALLTPDLSIGYNTQQTIFGQVGVNVPLPGADETIFGIPNLYVAYRMSIEENLEGNLRELKVYLQF